MLLAFLSMAAKGKPRRRRSMGRYLRGRIDENLALGTLAPVTLISVIFDETVIEKSLISSIVATWSMRNFTESGNDGPILVGVAHSDYTDGEIEAVIESTGSWNVGNKIEQEIAKRLVRIVGTFESSNQALGAAVLNDGKPIKTKLNWSLVTGQSLRLWAYNLGGSALDTTDPTVHVEGHANLFMK